METPKPQYLTVKQVAELLCVDIQTVYAWIAKGKMRSKDFSNRQPKRNGSRLRNKHQVRERKQRRISMVEYRRVANLREAGLPV